MRAAAYHQAGAQTEGSEKGGEQSACADPTLPERERLLWPPWPMDTRLHLLYRLNTLTPAALQGASVFSAPD